MDPSRRDVQSEGRGLLLMGLHRRRGVQPEKWTLVEQGSQRWKLQLASQRVGSKSSQGRLLGHEHVLFARW